MKNGFMRRNIRQFRKKKCKWIFSDESQFVKKDKEKAQV